MDRSKEMPFFWLPGDNKGSPLFSFLGYFYISRRGRLLSQRKLSPGTGGIAIFLFLIGPPFPSNEGSASPSSEKGIYPPSE